MSVQLVAHRGYSAHYPENTLAALRAAIALGVPAVEFDVQLSADQQLFLHHDATLERTTSGGGYIYKHTAAQLRKLNAGEERRFGRAFETEAIPSLEQALALLQPHPNVIAFVEVKRHSLEHFGLIPVMDPLLRVLQQHQNQCVLISFELEAVQYAKANSHMRCGWVLRDYEARSQGVAQMLEPDFLVCKHSRLPRKAPLWDGPWQWMVYEINDPDRVEALHDQGIIYIETAQVERMLQHPLLRPLQQSANVHNESV